MIETINKVVYKAFGLCIASEVVMPELSQVMSPDEPINVAIQLADLNDLWDRSLQQDEIYVVKQNFLCFR